MQAQEILNLMKETIANSGELNLALKHKKNKQISS